MNKKYIPILIAVVVAGGLGFFAGSKLGVASQPVLPGAGNFPGGTRMGAGRSSGEGGFVTGEILSKDSTSITVKLRNGGSTIVYYSDTTIVAKTVTGSLSDLIVGEQVSVAGNTNSDGSVTAKSVDIRPAGFFGANSTSTVK